MATKLKVGALGDNGKCCILIKQGMIKHSFSDELTFLWKHTSNKARHWPQAITSFNPKQCDGYVSQLPNVS